MLNTLCVMAVVAGACAGDEPDPKFALPPTPFVQETIARAKPEMVRQYVDALVGFGTRHSLSNTEGDEKGTGAARRWLKNQFTTFSATGSNRLTVELEEFDAPKMPRLPEGAHLVNVVARLPGEMPEAARRVVYVVGHYDSINGKMQDAEGAAPGANDDASGTAVVLECARLLAPLKLDATVVFLCTAAEEQGLLGAKYRAEKEAAGKEHDFVFVLNNDIVGDPSLVYTSYVDEGPKIGPLGPNVPPAGHDRPIPYDSKGFVRVFSEGIPRNPSAEVLAKIRGEGAENDSPSRQLARFVADVADREDLPLKIKLVYRLDRFLRGGDHSAFNDAGFPGVRFTVPAEDYSRQHATVVEKDGKPYGDLPEFVDAEYVANVARVNAAAIIHMANAPSPPKNAAILTKKLTETTTLRWDASPEPDVVGYEIMMRGTTDVQWKKVFMIEGNDQKVREISEIGVSKDNFFFGVRAVDRDGYRSPVAFCWAAKE